MAKDKKNKIVNILVRLSLYLIGLFLILTLVIFKGFITRSSKSDSVLYIYTIGITVFELSRVIASFFNRQHNKYKFVKQYFPLVTFIIPCKNEEAVIFETIRRCFEVDYQKDKIEVIVINDGSTDKTWLEIQKAKNLFSNLMAVNWQKNKGKRFAMVEGFRKASGEIVIQLDSDSFVKPKTFKHLIKPFSNPKIAAVCAHTDPLNKDENLITKMQAAYYFMSFRLLKAAESSFDLVFCCSGCCSAYKRKYVLPELENWKKEKFLGKLVSYGDDRALTNLMIRKGYKTIYSEKAKALTIVPNNLKKFIKQQIRWKKGWFINSLKALKFIFKRDPFVAVTYFLPLFIITLIAPFMAFKAIVYTPLFNNIFPLYYFIGVFLICLILTVHYFIFSKEKLGHYMFVWSLLNIFIFSYIIIYALFRIRDNRWGTR